VYPSYHSLPLSAWQWLRPSEGEINRSTQKDTDRKASLEIHLLSSSFRGICYFFNEITSFRPPLKHPGELICVHWERPLKCAGGSNSVGRWMEYHFSFTITDMVLRLRKTKMNEWSMPALVFWAPRVTPSVSLNTTSKS